MTKIHAVLRSILLAAAIASLTTDGAAGPNCSWGGDVDKGRTLFRNACSGCHNYDQQDWLTKGDPGLPCFSAADASKAPGAAKPHKWCDATCPHPKSSLCNAGNGVMAVCTGINKALYGAIQEPTLTAFRDVNNMHKMLDEPGYPGYDAAQVQKLFASLSMAEIRDIAAYLASRDPHKYSFSGRIIGAMPGFNTNFDSITICSDSSPQSYSTPGFAQLSAFKFLWSQDGNDLLYTAADGPPGRYWVSVTAHPLNKAGDVPVYLPTKYGEESYGTGQIGLSYGANGCFTKQPTVDFYRAALTPDDMNAFKDFVEIACYTSMATGELVCPAKVSATLLHFVDTSLLTMPLPIPTPEKLLPLQQFQQATAQFMRDGSLSARMGASFIQAAQGIIDKATTQAPAR